MAGPDPTPVASEGKGEGDTLRRPASCTELFLAFNKLALQGFGGVIAIAQHGLVDRERWMTRAQFLETLSMAQVLPGPNIMNLALMIGDRFFGTRGAFAALGGMLAVPLVIVLVLAALYAGNADQPRVAGALRGMGAVSAGLMFGTAIKLASTWRTQPLSGPLFFGVCGIALVLVVVLRLPLAWVVLSLGAVSMAFAWRALVRSRSKDMP